MNEEKKEIKKYYLGEKELAEAGNRTFVEGVTALVEAKLYNETAGKLKATEYILKQKVELIDQKNKEIDEMSEGKKVVAESAYLEVAAKYKACVNKLKKLGAYSGE